MNEMEVNEGDDGRRDGSKRDHPQRRSKGKVDVAVIGVVPDPGSQEKNDSAPEMGVKELDERQVETTGPAIKTKKKRFKPYKDDPNIEQVPLTDYGFFIQVGDMHREKSNFDEDGKEKKSRERITFNLLLEFEGKPEA